MINPVSLTQNSHIFSVRGGQKIQCQGGAEASTVIGRDAIGKKIDEVTEMEAAGKTTKQEKTGDDDNKKDEHGRASANDSSNFQMD